MVDPPPAAVVVVVAFEPLAEVVEVVDPVDVGMWYAGAPDDWFPPTVR